MRAKARPTERGLERERAEAAMAAAAECLRHLLCSAAPTSTPRSVRCRASDTSSRVSRPSAISLFSASLSLRPSRLGKVDVAEAKTAGRGRADEVDD